MATQKRKRNFIRRHLKKDRACPNCGVAMVSMEELVNLNGGKKVKVFPDNLATYEHKYPRFNPKRGTEKSCNSVLCQKCNNELGANQLREFNLIAKSMLLSLFILIPLLTTAQTVTLPTWLADSMIFEVQKGRQCSVVLEAQANELEKQGLELVATGTALRLSEKKGVQLDSLVVNARESSEILAKQFNQDRKALKRKVRIRNLVILGEAALFLVLIL